MSGSQALALGGSSLVQMALDKCMRASARLGSSEGCRSDSGGAGEPGGELLEGPSGFGSGSGSGSGAGSPSG